ncbi:hypothetical protein ACVJBD_000454 [Rhizobium mongolense]
MWQWSIQSPGLSRLIWMVLRQVQALDIQRPEGIAVQMDRWEWFEVLIRSKIEAEGAPQ